MTQACLIVDDSKTTRRALDQILRALGFTVRQACDGAAALEHCRRDMPSVVFLDWTMPVMDGYECLTKLRRMPGGDLPTVIFCSSVNDETRIKRALEAGADEYVMKPFDDNIIRAKLARFGFASP